MVNKKNYSYLTIFMLVIVPIVTGLLYFNKIIDSRTNILIDSGVGFVWFALTGFLAYKEKYFIVAAILLACDLLGIVLVLFR